MIKVGRFYITAGQIAALITGVGCLTVILVPVIVLAVMVLFGMYLDATGWEAP